eukprot:Skav217909  [mRNA]  locus=scaffold795:195487:196013:+ [translate_table: standard]
MLVLSRWRYQTPLVRSAHAARTPAEPPAYATPGSFKSQTRPMLSTLRWTLLRYPDATPATSEAGTGQKRKGAGAPPTSRTQKAEGSFTNLRSSCSP